MNEAAIFQEALSKPIDERLQYLDQACAGAPELRSAVEAMLAAHEQGDHPTDGKPDALAQTVDSAQPEVGIDITSDFTSPSASSPMKMDAYRGRAEESVVIAGRYTLQEKIGEGGMGEVWTANQSEPVKRKVALKLIKAGMDSRAVLQRFEQERQALALMDHPNISRVLDGGMTPTGQPFFVMELVDGLPLTKFSDEMKLSLRERLELFMSICEAVQHAHQKGVVHRDLKPANILVTVIDGRPVPKVIDFGVAKAISGKLTEETMATGFGAIVGTLEYMSPEQAGFSGDDIDTRADIYSLGVVLYELLTGLRPIDAVRLKKAALTEMIRIVCEEEPTKPSTRVSTDESLPTLAALRQTEPRKLTAILRGELDWVVMKCLEKQRDRRYETANGLARDIQRYLADETVDARPPSAWYRIQKLVKRNRTAVFAGSIVILALIGGAVGATLGMVRAEKARRAEAKQRREADVARDREKSARKRAEAYAAANAQLAASEREAKLVAEAATKEKEEQLLRTKAILFTSQMERVAQIRDEDPNAALKLLHDTEVCPVNMRDLAWNFANNACKRQQLASFAIPYSAHHAISSDGKLLATVDLRVKSNAKNSKAKVTILEIPSGQIRAELSDFPEPVRLLAFSPNGDKLAVVADGGLGLHRDPNGELQPRNEVPGTVQIWDVADATRQATLEGHTDQVIALDFSPNGEFLCTGGMDNTARIWDLNSAKEVHNITEHDKEVTAVAFSPDGKRLATGGLDNIIRLWSLDGFQLEATWTPSTNEDPALEAARKRPPTLVEGVIATNLAGQQDAVIDLDFSVDGRSLVSANTNWLIEVRDVATGNVRSTLRDLNGPVDWVQFHRDGNSVLVSSPNTSNGTTQWDLTTGQKVQSLGSNSLFCKRRSLLFIMAAFQCRILDLDAPVELAQFKTEPVKGNPTVAVFDGSGDVLAVACGNRIFLWNVHTKELIKALDGHKNLVLGLAVSPDGRTLASSSTTGGTFIGRLTDAEAEDVHLWDMTTGKLLGTIPLGQSKTPSLSFSPDGTTLATLHFEGNAVSKPRAIVSIWDVKTRQRKFTLETPELQPSVLFLEDRSQLAFNPVNGSLVVATGRFLGIWNLETRELERQILAGSAERVIAASEFLTLAISPNGKQIVTANRITPVGMELNVWSSETGVLIHKLRDEFGSFITFSPDGRNMLTSRNTSVQIWDTLTMQKRLSFVSHSLEGSASRMGLGMVGLALSPDGQMLATGVLPRQGTVANTLSEGAAEVKLWNLKRSPTILSLPARGQIPAIFSFAPDSKSLMEEDRGGGVLRIWNLETGVVLSTIDTTRNRIGTLRTPDGRYLAGTDILGTSEERRQALVGGYGDRFNTLTGKCRAAVNLWDLKVGRLQTIEVGNGAPTGLAFSADSKTMAVVHDTSIADELVQDMGNSLEIWDLSDGKSVATWPFPAVRLSSPAFSPSGDIVILAAINYDTPQKSTANHRVLVVDVKTGKVLQALLDAPDDSSPREFRFSNDGARLIVRRGVGGIRGPKDGPVTMWDWRTGEKIDQPIPNLFDNDDISPNGRYELRRLPHGVEVVDRTLTQTETASRRAE